MTVQLPDFRLEVYLGEWEFKARHHLTASDAETLTIAELLALGSDEDRDAFSRLGLGYAPTWGGDELRAAIAGTYETHRRRAPRARLRGCRGGDVLGAAGAASARATTRSSPSPTTSRWRP